MIKILVVIILAVIAYNVLTGGSVKLMTGGAGETTSAPAQAPTVQSALPQVATTAQAANKDEIYKNNPNILAFPQMSNNFTSQGTFQPAASSLACFPKDELTAAELLPKDGAFLDSNPTAQGTLNNRNLFEAGHHSGLNTQINSLRNANRQLRSDPLIPRVAIGPWSQSTYEADTNRREFEIGGI